MATFCKAERLCSRSVIDRLYADGKKLMVYPLSVHWMERPCAESEVPLQVLLVAPKKRLHHAVDRNRTKRIMRECWRQRKQPLIELLEQQRRGMVVGIHYVDNRVGDTPHLSRSFDKVAEKLSVLWSAVAKDEGEEMV